MNDTDVKYAVRGNVKFLLLYYFIFIFLTQSYYQ